MKIGDYSAEQLVNYIGATDMIVMAVAQAAFVLKPNLLPAEKFSKILFRSSLVGTCVAGYQAIHAIEVMRKNNAFDLTNACIVGGGVLTMLGFVATHVPAFAFAHEIIVYGEVACAVAGMRDIFLHGADIQNLVPLLIQADFVLMGYTGASSLEFSIKNAPKKASRQIIEEVIEEPVPPAVPMPTRKISHHFSNEIDYRSPVLLYQPEDQKCQFLLSMKTVYHLLKANPKINLQIIDTSDQSVFVKEITVDVSKFQAWAKEQGISAASDGEFLHFKVPNNQSEDPLSISIVFSDPNQDSQWIPFKSLINHTESRALAVFDNPYQREIGGRWFRKNHQEVLKNIAQQNIEIDLSAEAPWNLRVPVNRENPVMFH